MSRIIKISIAIAATLALSSLIVQHAFRVEREDNPALGLFEYKYHWWQPRELALDSNRDGSIDAKGILVKGAVDFRDSFQEYWEDTDFDRHFEIHVLFQDRDIDFVEFDEDHDGKYERKIVGEEAASFFENRTRSGSPGSQPEH